MDSKTHKKVRPKRKRIALRSHDEQKIKQPFHKSVQRKPFDPKAVLTWREREVLVRIASGTCDEEIAKELNLSLAEVETHINDIHKKINAPDRLQVVLWVAAHL